MGGVLCKLKSNSAETSQTAIVEKRLIVVLGAARVGKTAIIQQFLNSHFIRRYQKTIEDFISRDYVLSDGRFLTLQILDTSGVYSFPAMEDVYYKRSDAFVIVYAVDDPKSVDMIKEITQKIQAVRHNNAPIVIVANKVGEDGIVRRVHRETVAEFVNTHNAVYIECSAKNNMNINAIFEDALHLTKIEHKFENMVANRRRRSVFYPLFSTM